MSSPLFWENGRCEIYWSASLMTYNNSNIVIVIYNARKFLVKFLKKLFSFNEETVEHIKIQKGRQFG